MTRYGLLLAALIGAVSHPASADDFSINDSEEGWVCNGACAGNNGTDPNNNYIAGVLTGDQYRNWFEFSIPTLTGGSLVSATFEVNEGGSSHMGGSLTYAVYGLSAQPLVFTDVSASNPFGSVVTTNASNGTTLDITLNAAALAAIGAAQGGNIFIGGIDSGELASTDTFDFASEGASTVLSLQTAPSSVPEPSSWALFTSVLLAMGCVARKRRLKLHDPEESCLSLSL